MSNELVLVTGGSGRIGREVVEDLLERGYRVRATYSTSTVPPAHVHEMLEWQRVDLGADEDLFELVEGCDVIIHLAAELGRKDRMARVNGEATRCLAQAAEGAGASVFCYASTIAVYGSGRTIQVDETSPVLDHTRDIPSQYWALDYVREYGRTKLSGELALRSTARNMRYFILRPAVVVSPAQLIGIRDWNMLKRLLASHRHAHHIYVKDVSDAFIWFMQQGLLGRYTRGQVEVYNLSEDDRPEPRHIDFMRKAYASSGDRRYLTVAAPGFLDWMHDFMRFRASPLRHPLWRMRFSNAKLLKAGFRFRFGMRQAEATALAILRDEGHPSGTGD